MQIRTLVLAAGSVLSFVGFAQAQNAVQNEVVADAAARSSLLAQGGGSYGDNGFNISDASGDNRLTIGGFLDFRYGLSIRDDASVGDTNDFTTGFSAPLTRVRTSGTIGTRELSYKIQIAFMGEGGSATIDDAFAQWDFGNGWAARWGQFNLPVVREITIGAEDHLGADFSIGSQVFGQGYSQGVMFSYQAEQFRLMGAFSDGAGTANTNNISSPVEADYALSIRGEGLILGSDFNMFNNYTSWRSTQGDNVLLGGAVHWQSGGETGGTADVDALIYTVDATWEGPGYNVTGAFYGRKVDPAGGTETSDFGFTAQGGFFFSDQFEGFARYDGIFFDSDAVLASDEDTMHFLAVGVNYYVFPETNAAKFTFQLGYAFSNTNALYNTTGAYSSTDLEGNTENGFLGDTEEGEVSLQAKFQTIF